MKLAHHSEVFLFSSILSPTLRNQQFHFYFLRDTKPGLSLYSVGTSIHSQYLLIDL